jgi:hypothetical protein
VTSPDRVGPRRWRDRAGDAVEALNALAEAGDGLDGCTGCLHVGHCLPVLVLAAALPAALIWSWF